MAFFLSPSHFPITHNNDDNNDDNNNDNKNNNNNNNNNKRIPSPFTQQW